MYPYTSILTDRCYYHVEMMYCSDLNIFRGSKDGLLE